MRKFLCLAVLVAVAMIGCGQTSVVGKWTADPAKSTVPMGNTPEEKKAAEAMLKSFTIELNEDKTATITMMIPLKGTWSQSGNTVTFKPDAAMPGMSEMKLTLAGSNLEMTDPQGKATDKIVFTKSS